MSKQKLTDWFDADVKPVHVGWYQRNWGDFTEEYENDYWDGEHWFYGENGKAKEYSVRNCEWRGLAEQPKQPR